MAGSFPFLAADMMLKGIHPIGLFQSTHRRAAFSAAPFEVSEEQYGIVGMKKLLNDQAQDLLEDNYEYFEA